MPDPNLATRKSAGNTQRKIHGEVVAWRYHVLHGDDRPAQRHVHEDDWPKMHRFEDDGGTS